jgi:SAM-dependent methyltransferase
VSEGYDPAQYWSARLEGTQGLRGTGHWLYSERYNRWLYRRKGSALRRALAGIPASIHALDVGSGTGWVVEQLLALGTTVEGCDIATPAVEDLRRRYPDVTFFELTLGVDSVPRPDEVYDAITAMDVLYHVTDETQWEAAVAELARVLRPGGRLVITDTFGSSDVHPAAHVRFRSMDRWLDRAAALGLEVHATGPLYRWLSREPDQPGFRRLPDGLRGAAEYALERVAPEPAHMRWFSLVKKT